ncbi:HAMP domain-containing protein [Candidatus Gracilibacteria bacterium]|nr:HAMP domain-containing protein [Candidatus Gracilibacteria bacterium]
MTLPFRILLVIVIIAFCLMLGIGWMGAPGYTQSELVSYLLLAGLLSLGLSATGLYWLRRGQGPIWLQMTVTYGLGVVIAICNIFLTTRLMLVASSDAPLLVLLLLFGGVVSLGLGIGLAHTIAQRINALERSARELAAGNLNTRVEPQGNDELAALAYEFNRMGQQLAESAAERERQEAARRDLIAAVSHDLRTPLASLRALNEALADGMVEDPATKQRYFATMRAQIGVISSLIDDLFELARIDAGALTLDRQSIAAADLLSDTLNGLRPQALAQGVDICADLVVSLPPIEVDVRQIERVLYNLTANAIRHTPAGGWVRLNAEHAPTNAGHIAGLKFSVQDNGEGIVPEDLPHVFDRFYRGEKSRSRATGVPASASPLPVASLRLTAAISGSTANLARALVSSLCSPCAPQHSDALRLSPCCNL